MMMIIHRLPILGIILTIHPFILTGTLAQPIKILIDFDISGPPRSRMVETIPSTEFPGGNQYGVKTTSKSRNVIGMVRDAEEILIDGDARAVSRYVLVQNRQNSLTYIRVTTRWRIRGNTFRTAIDEFVKRPGDAHYRRIARVPIELDILSMDTHYIEVTKSEDLPGIVVGTSIGRMITIKYSIKSQFWTTNSIGIVKYGGLILTLLNHDDTSYYGGA